LNQDGIITPQINGINVNSGAYIANITQVGTNAPTANEFANSIGEITWTRTATGEYLGTPLIPFVKTSTFVIIGNVEHDYLASAYINTDGNVVIITCRTQTHAHADSKLNNSPLEIRVYE